MKKLFLIATMVLLAAALHAQSVVGKWKTIDDESGKPRSIVEIYQKDGKLYGKIIKLFREPGEEADPVCDKCPGKLKNKKVIGLEIIQGLSQSGDTWNGGKILDPESGKLYDCKIWLKNDKELNVRGYVMFFYRTQTWQKEG